jgi:hypothetical protein
MIALMLLAVLAIWLLLSAVTTVVCAAVVRGGLREEQATHQDRPRLLA